MDAGPPLQAVTRAYGALIRDLLHDKTARMREEAFVLEGAKSCVDLIRRHPQAVVSLVVSSRYLQEEDETSRRIRSKSTVRQFSCSDIMFEKLSDVLAPQGMLAVVRQPQWEESRVLGQPRVLGIYGDRLRDPSNVGMIIRTAAALDLTGVWLSADSADHFSAKVVRATAGAILTLPVFRIRDLQTFAAYHCSIYSALVPSPGTVPLRNIHKIPRRIVIAIGNEGTGLAKNVVKQSDVKFSIPLARGIQSLNVAATAAITAFHMTALPVEQNEPDG